MTCRDRAACPGAPFRTRREISGCRITGRRTRSADWTQRAAKSRNIQYRIKVQPQYIRPCPRPTEVSGSPNRDQTSSEDGIPRLEQPRNTRMLQRRKRKTRGRGGKPTLTNYAQGRVWGPGGPLTVFDPKAGKFTRFPEVPTAYGLAIDKDGNCWFAEYAPYGKIGKVDGKTLKVTKWSPTTPDARPRRIQIDSDGTVWFAEFEAGKIGQFDPKTETFKEYSLP